MNKKFLISFFLFLSMISVAQALTFQDITITATDSNTVVEINAQAETDALNYDNNSINFTNLYQNFQITRDGLLYIDQTDSYHNYSFSDGAYYTFVYASAQSTCQQKISVIIDEYSTFGELFILLVLITVGTFVIKSMNEENSTSIKNVTEIGKVIIVVGIMIVLAIIIMLQFGGIC